VSSVLAERGDLVLNIAASCGKNAAVPVIVVT